MRVLPLRRRPVAYLVVAGLAASPAGAVGAPNTVAGALATWTKKHPDTGALVVRLGPTGSETLASHRPDLPHMPASTMKVVTSAGALLAMGPDFRFRTTLLQGPDTVRKGSTLAGPVYLKGSADPVLATRTYARTYLGRYHTDLGTLARALRAQGIRRHTGATVVDPTVLDARRTGLQWRSYYWQYSPPLSGAPVNQNYMLDSRSRYAPNPDRGTASQLARVFKANGIRNTGPVRVAPTPAQARVLATVTSPPLSMILRAMNPDSDNFIAETLRKSVGAYAGGRGTTAEGNRVTTMLLRDRGLLGPSDVLVDGSGLSRANQVSATTLVSILEAAYREPAWGDGLIMSLPTGGTGTLIRRFREPGIRSRVHAKTGYINGVSSLAGVATSPSGERYAFAFVMNDWDIGGAKATQDRIVKLLASGRADFVPGVPRPAPTPTTGTTTSPGSLLTPPSTTTRTR